MKKPYELPEESLREQEGEGGGFRILNEVIPAHECEEEKKEKKKKARDPQG
jgi:hypothetical protein